MLILKRAMRLVCRGSVLGFVVAVGGKHSLARQLMVEIGDAVGHYGGDHGGMLLIAGILAVEDIVFGMPDFAVAEVGAVNVGQAEIIGGHTLHSKHRGVVAAELRGTLARLGHGHLKGEVGVDARYGLAHLLHVIDGTPMHKMLTKGKLKLMEKDEYVDLVVDQLEILPPHMVIHRLTGDAVREELIGPMWSLKKWEVLNAIDDRLKERNTYQGRLYKKEEK